MTFPLWLFIVGYAIATTWLMINPYVPSFRGFPEMITGHTCVHLKGPNKQPIQPAVMVLQGGKPFFTDLLTNQTIGSYYDYTKRSPGSVAYHRIFLTSPVYHRQSLYTTLTRPNPIQYSTMHPTVRDIYAKRKLVWWERCMQHWGELTELQQKSDG
jgi:hypothetical protein